MAHKPIAYRNNNTTFQKLVLLHLMMEAEPVSEGKNIH
jgi:hypothetical protein